MWGSSLRFADYRRRREARPSEWESGPWKRTGEAMPFPSQEAAWRACALGPVYLTCVFASVFDMLDGWRNVDVCGGELPRQTEP